MNKNVQNKRAYILTIVILTIIVIMIIFFYLIYKKEKDYVTSYNESHNNTYNQDIRCPKINVNIDGIDSINEEINEYCEYYSDDTSKYIDYNYNVKDNILSVIIKLVDKNLQNVNTKFLSYNIDLKSKVVISNEDLLKKYGYSEENVESSINNRMLDLYNYETNEGYIEKNECDYECYLSIRMIEPLIDNVELYLSDNGLVVYKSFNIYSEYEDHVIFEKEDFIFKLK